MQLLDWVTGHSRYLSESATMRSETAESRSKIRSWSVLWKNTGLVALDRAHGSGVCRWVVNSLLEGSTSHPYSCALPWVGANQGRLGGPVFERLVPSVLCLDHRGEGFGGNRGTDEKAL